MSRCKRPWQKILAWDWGWETLLLIWTESWTLCLYVEAITPTVSALEIQCQGTKIKGRAKVKIWCKRSDVLIRRVMRSLFSSFLCLSVCLSESYREAVHPLTRKKVFIASRTMWRYIWFVSALRSLVSHYSSSGWQACEGVATVHVP